MAESTPSEDRLRTIQMSDASITDASTMPEKIGKYPILRPLGRGGMGVVYLAMHPELRIQVAIKVLPGELGSHDPQFGERFLDEARLMARVSHANVVRVFDVGEDESTQFLVMEYLPGGSVRDQLREQGQLPVATVLSIGIGVAHALQAADRHGIVHRDIKPDNILLDDAGQPKLADLGMAKSLELARDNSLTTTGIAMGTPHYMAPEQARSAKHADRRSDIYSLGATLYHLLTGSPPFEDETAVGVILKHCSEPIPDATVLRPDLPPAFSQLLNRMMAKDPAVRPQTADALLSDLQAIADNLKTTKPPVASKRRTAWIAVVALCLILVLLAAFWPKRGAPPVSTATTARPTSAHAGEMLIDDEFSSASTLSQWQRINEAENWDWNPIEQIDIGETRPGWLTVIPKTSAWYRHLRGALLFQPVAGDAVITTRVTIRGRNGDMPQADYSVAGPMLRQPGSTENGVWLAMGSKDAPFSSYYHEFKNTENSTVTPEFEEATSSTSDLRIVRVTSIIILMTRQGDGDWQIRRQFHRPDFAYEVQGGLGLGSDYSGASSVAAETYQREGASGHPDLIAQFDFFRVQRVNGMLPQTISAASDAQLIAWFGAPFDR